MSETTHIVIFGATGDLTRRKLVPALYNLYRKGRLPTAARIVGFARRDWSDERLRDVMREGVREFATKEYEAFGDPELVMMALDAAPGLDRPRKWTGERGAGLHTPATRFDRGAWRE